MKFIAAFSQPNQTGDIW